MYGYKLPEFKCPRSHEHRWGPPSTRMAHLRAEMTALPRWIFTPVHCLSLAPHALSLEELEPEPSLSSSSSAPKSRRARNWRQTHQIAKARTKDPAMKLQGFRRCTCTWRAQQMHHASTRPAPMAKPAALSFVFQFTIRARLLNLSAVPWSAADLSSKLCSFASRSASNFMLSLITPMVPSSSSFARAIPASPTAMMGRQPTRGTVRWAISG
mmetsp:Transcript_94416/g.237007  ORF Transcript_94416/g.237007 Transcript_94416/m.237007 type:complete len:212 (-) Transcript_94416:35-670(-)